MSVDIKRIIRDQPEQVHSTHKHSVIRSMLRQPSSESERIALQEIEHSAGKMADLYTDLLTVGHLSKKIREKEISNLGVVLIGPNILEIVGVSTALQSLDVEKYRIYGIEKNFRILEKRTANAVMTNISSHLRLLNNGQNVNFGKEIANNGKVSIPLERDNELFLIHADASATSIRETVTSHTNHDAFFIFSGDLDIMEMERAMEKSWGMVFHNWMELSNSYPFIIAATADKFIRDGNRLEEVMQQEAEKVSNRLKKVEYGPYNYHNLLKESDQNMFAAGYTQNFVYEYSNMS